MTCEHLFLLYSWCSVNTSFNSILLCFFWFCLLENFILFLQEVISPNNVCVVEVEVSEYISPPIFWTLKKVCEPYIFFKHWHKAEMVVETGTSKLSHGECDWIWHQLFWYMICYTFGPLPNLILAVRALRSMATLPWTVWGVTGSILI